MHTSDPMGPAHGRLDKHSAALVCQACLRHAHRCNASEEVGPRLPTEPLHTTPELCWYMNCPQLRLCRRQGQHTACPVLINIHELAPCLAAAVLAAHCMTAMPHLHSASFAGCHCKLGPLCKQAWTLTCQVVRFQQEKAGLLLTAQGQPAAADAVTELDQPSPAARQPVPQKRRSAVWPDITDPRFVTGARCS